MGPTLLQFCPVVEDSLSAVGLASFSIAASESPESHWGG